MLLANLQKHNDYVLDDDQLKDVKVSLDCDILLEDIFAESVATIEPLFEPV